MKRRNRFLSGLIATATLASSLVIPGGMVLATENELTKDSCDENFWNAIASYDLDKSDSLNEEEMSAIDALSLESMGIASLSGIEKFTNLKCLKCNGNDLTELDVSGLTNLEVLDCSKNSISSLKLGNNDALYTLLCYGNELTELDLSGAPNAKFVMCFDNNLTTLDLAGTQFSEGHEYEDASAMPSEEDNTTFYVTSTTGQSFHYSTGGFKFNAEGILADMDVTFTNGLEMFPVPEVVEPTDEPTNTPEVTDEPTVEPTEDPEATVEPTAEPTEEPEVTVEPTAEPTEAPEVTTEPTGEPTTEPTVEPTEAPEVTTEPTAEPTKEPEVTSEPTAEPTKEPVTTTEPTKAPVVTTEPTAEPTKEPAATTEPTKAPEVTTEPTAEPTKTPAATEEPTAEPTKKPATTEEPTTEPTKAPEVTAEPTAEPTEAPVKETGAAGFAERLYTTCLGRPAEKEGKEFWIKELENGRSGADIALGFFFSPELIDMKLSDEEFVTRLYATFMDREPDPEGFKYWIDHLNSGKDRKFVFDGFINSKEWGTICFYYGIESGGLYDAAADLITDDIKAFAERMYTTCLGRKAEPAGLDFWSRELAARRQSGTEVAIGFFFSPEFVEFKLKDEEYVNRLYRTFLGREAEKDGFDFWVAELKAGKTRLEVFFNFSYAPEFAKLCEAAGILR